MEDQSFFDTTQHLLVQQDLLVEQLNDARRTFERAVRDLSLTRRITESLRYAREVKRVCEIIIDTILDETRAESCSLMWFDEQTNEFYLKAAKSQTDPGTYYHDPNQSKRTFHGGEGIAGWVAATGEAILITDTQQDTRFITDTTYHEKIRSILCLPLINQETVVGVINLSHPQPHTFTEEDRRTMVVIADQIAIAMQNVRLMEELQEANLALQREIRLSEEQAAMIKEAYEELQKAHQDLKTMQKHLIQTEKLRALGEMVAGVAHNFNNILNGVAVYIQLMQMQQSLPPTVAKHLQAIDQHIQNGASIIKRMQDFALGRSAPFAPFDLNKAVTELVEITKPKWKHAPIEQEIHIALKMILCDIPLIIGSETQIGEVLTNLIFNAVDALPQGGRITIRTSCVEEWVILEVEDTGIGMSPEIQQRIFEPFFTTKEPDKGTGLGLSTTYGIISQHRGEINVTSSIGKGTTFTIKLPLYQPTLQTERSREDVRSLVLK